MALRLLTISLDDGAVVPEELPPSIEQLYLGGRGAASWLIATRVGSKVGPLSPANLLVFSAGPLTGAIPAASGSFVVTTRSPLTRLIGHSWGLGRWGALLRRAGIDLLALSGRRDEWCYITIDDGAVTIHSAQRLLGLDTAATAQALREELGDGFATVCIGQAGEAGVSYSSIVAEGAYMAEPAGTGAVMAHKRVKAIAVRGTQPLAPADRGRVDAVFASIARRIATSDVAAGLRQYGSLYYAARAEERGALTGRNGQDVDVSGIGASTRAALAQRGRRESRGCEGCPIPCHSAYIRKNGEPMAYPELDALAGFGARCGITNVDTLIVINDLCVRLGLDIVETSAAIGFMMECQEQGLSKADNLHWGDGDEVLAAIRRLGQRQEKRDILSLGAGEIREVYYGSADFAPQVKGLAMTALDPRALPKLALALALAPIGGDYRYAMMLEELLPEPPAWLPEDAAHPQAIRGKAPRLIWYERFAAALDAAGLCRRLALMAFQITPAEVNELISATVGRPFSGLDVARIGERIVTFERLWALRFDAGADALPHRWSETPLEDGPAAGMLPPIEDMRAEYYRRHGWDEEGRPTAARLAELGMADA
jgi:aldehyde:ferredoxin oxidoreductase